ITNHLLCTLTQQAVGACAQDMPETLPRGVRLDHELAQAEFSYRNIHFPESFEALELARRRLTFEELFYLSAGLAMLKERRGDVLGGASPPRPMEDFLARLPCPLTGALRRLMEGMAGDPASGRPTTRLVRGDVGSWVCPRPC